MRVLQLSLPCREVAEQFDAVFRTDRTHNLINRLRHNVIRTGLRRVNMAYSRISLADVAKKLGAPPLPNEAHIEEEDAMC